MWTANCESLPDARGLRIAMNLDAGPATFADAIREWQCNAEFRSEFNSLLADTPYRAYRWETPAVTAATLTRPFEFVVLDLPSLARPADQLAFAEHFADAEDGVAVFANLGGDAIMVVPSPQGEASAYGHLAAFVRNAPAAQQQSLWRSVGTAMERRVGDRPVWLSTAGAGVSWLHVRLDDRPKYYGYGPYREGTR